MRIPPVMPIMSISRRSAAAVFALAIAVAGATPAAAAAPKAVKVVASLPNLGAIAAAVGGARIALTVIASGVQDAHFVDPKPAFMVKVRAADLLIVNGLDLE